MVVCTKIADTRIYFLAVRKDKMLKSTIEGGEGER